MTGQPPDSAITEDPAAEPPVVGGLAARPLDFAYLRLKGGGEAGARDLFQGLVGQLVTNIRPGAREVEGSGGDWGIDVFVGELTTDGEVGVWQAKYFIDGLKPPQRRQIESSFDAAVKKAEERGYRLGAWTLCVPCLLTPAEWTWWQRFRRERENASGVPIFLMEATALKERLYAPECVALRRAFFDWPDAPVPLALVELPSESAYDGALFVDQLKHGGVTETASAKREFFNAELLVHEVTDKAIPMEVNELAQRSAEVHAIWEHRFNARAADPSDDLRVLHGEVMKAVERHHRDTPVGVLRAAMIHTLGLVHRHVDDGHAGWCREWRTVAESHGR